MINIFLAKQFKHEFHYSPTEEQLAAFGKLADFILSKETDTLFLLTGYAGTGKTSLISAVVRTLQELGQKTILLAPTGRAAKVFSNYSEGQKAYTIHKKIYRQKAFSGEPRNAADASLSSSWFSRKFSMRGCMSPRNCQLQVTDSAVWPHLQIPSRAS